MYYRLLTVQKVPELLLRQNDVEKKRFEKANTPSSSFPTRIFNMEATEAFSPPSNVRTLGTHE